MSLNKDSDSILDALIFMKMYSYQLLKYNIFVSSIKITNFGVIVEYNEGDTEYINAYILKRYRGKKLLKKIVRSSDKSLIVLSDSDTNLTSYCTRQKINCRYVGAFEKESAYIKMKEYLGDRMTDIGIHDINKIEQTLAVLEWMKSSNICKIATCYMSRMSTEDELTKNWNSFNSKDDPKAILLAMEYRRIILKYSVDAVAHMSPTNIFADLKIPSIKEVTDAILAHIIVNYYSFEKNYKRQHPRAGKIEPYFTNWLVKLEATQLYTIFKNRLSSIDIFDELISKNNSKASIERDELISVIQDEVKKISDNINNK